MPAKPLERWFGAYGQYPAIALGIFFAGLYVGVLMAGNAPTALPAPRAQLCSERVNRILDKMQDLHQAHQAPACTGLILVPQPPRGVEKAPPDIVRTSALAPLRFLLAPFR